MSQYNISFYIFIKLYSNCFHIPPVWNHMKTWKVLTGEEGLRVNVGNSFIADWDGELLKMSDSQNET